MKDKSKHAKEKENAKNKNKHAKEKENKKEKKKQEKENAKEKKKQKKEKKKSRKILWKILLVLVVLLAIACGVFAYKVQRNGGGLQGMLATMVGHDENTKKNLGEFKCLLLGISTDLAGSSLTDTIIVASYNPNTQKATLLSIPRDTYTGKNSAKATAYEKINALYARKDRPDETLKAVNEITGLDIEYYAVVKTEALIELVDAIGGVTFNVPIDMVYDDPTQDLHINLKAGEQLLDGDKAEQLVRYRHGNWDPVKKTYPTYPAEYGDNDLGRMRTQREFIMQVIKQTAKVENIFKMGQILDVAKNNLITNIDFDTAKDYIPYLVEFDTSNILTATLPGTVPNLNETNNVSVFVYNKKETKTLVQELFHDRDKTEEDLEEEGNLLTEKSEIKIQVLNGSEDKDKLDDVIKKLKAEGYKVTQKDTTNKTDKTVIIRNKDVSSEISDNIIETIGAGIEQSSESTSSQINLTIVIGKDYE